MKKLIIFVSLLFVLTGCEATYNLDIDEDYNEVVTSIPYNNEELREMELDQFNYPAYYDPLFFEEEYGYVEGVTRYNISFNDRLEYRFKFNERYQDSNIANTASENFDVYYSDDNMKPSNIFASGFGIIFNEYSNLSKLTINIKFSGEVSSHNADYVNGNIYSWVVTKDNQDRELIFHYINEKKYSSKNVNSKTGNNTNGSPDNNINLVTQQNDSTSKSNQENNEKKDSKFFLYVLYSLFFGLIFVIIIFRKKFKR